MYDNYLQTQLIVEKELMLTNLAKRGTAHVKFQDDEDDSPVIFEYSSCSKSLKSHTQMKALEEVCFLNLNPTSVSVLPL